jgi:hypothetical protein
VVWIRNAVSALLQPCIYWASSRLPLQCTKKKSPDPNAYDEWDRNCSSYCASPVHPFCTQCPYRYGSESGGWAERQGVGLVMGTTHLLQLLPLSRSMY